jgi:hypothetical protein
MSHTVETAPPARDRSAEARRAARQAKASRERRIITSLNRGVSVAVIAEWEDVSEKRMRALVRDILARRMPEPPAQFLAMQVSRLNEALRVSFDAMSGANFQAVDRVVKIVRELDRYHGFVAAERWGLPDRSEALEEADSELLARLVERIRETTPRPEKIESAPENGMAVETPSPRDPALRRDGAFASALDPAGQTPLSVEPPLASPHMAPQEPEKIESAPGNGMASETADPQDVAPPRDGVCASALERASHRDPASARCEPLVSLAAANPSGPRRVNMRMTPNGVVACP